ncbi:MAG: hypothetical protein WCB56_04220, partial [Terriglobales bacterium]
SLISFLAFILRKSSPPGLGALVSGKIGNGLLKPKKLISAAPDSVLLIIGFGSRGISVISDEKKQIFDFVKTKN